MFELECEIPESIPRYLLVTFGDGSLGWRNAARRLRRQTEAFGMVAKMIGHDRKSLQNIIPELKSLNFNRRTRGFGYWIWKPLLVSYYISNCPTGIDGIIYLDAGCTLNLNSKSRERFSEYLKLSQEFGGLGFQMNHREEAWTKEDLLHLLDTGIGDRNSGQVLAGAFFLEKNTGAALAEEWLQLALQSHLLDDSPSKLSNSVDFIEHRHDQSIFSLLAKKYNLLLLPDETAFHPGVNLDQAQTFENKPIWATRHRSFMNSLSMNPVIRVVRSIERNVP